MYWALFCRQKTIAYNEGMARGGRGGNQIADNCCRGGRGGQDPQNMVDIICEQSLNKEKCVCTCKKN